MKHNKIWGLTEKLFSKNNVEIHRIEINKGGYCSKHLHKSKYNIFYVESGEIEVHLINKNGIVDKTILTTGEISNVAPGAIHMFRGNRDSVAYEIYYSELNTDDIERFSTGGIK